MFVSIWKIFIPNRKRMLSKCVHLFPELVSLDHACVCIMYNNVCKYTFHIQTYNTMFPHACVRLCCGPSPPILCKIYI